jgi:hypothetical protein
MAMGVCQQRRSAPVELPLLAQCCLQLGAGTCGCMQLHLRTCHASNGHVL